jgi:hypothetical protein
MLEGWLAAHTMIHLVVVPPDDLRLEMCDRHVGGHIGVGVLSRNVV